MRKVIAVIIAAVFGALMCSSIQVFAPESDTDDSKSCMDVAVITEHTMIERSTVHIASTTMLSELTTGNTTSTRIATERSTTEQITAATISSSIITTTVITEVTKVTQASEQTMSGIETIAQSDVETSASYDMELTYIGSFRGTYYRGNTNPCNGGSGRRLIECASGGEIRGSIACRYIYQTYGYNYNGRTTVYIEVPSYPSMDGWYYVDDCCASNSVVDFYYPNYSACPFQRAGVISVNLYIVE